MRKFSALVVAVCAVLTFGSVSQAATQLRLPANNQFVNAISTDPDTGVTVGIFVSRAIGAPGGPVDTIAFSISTPFETTLFGTAVLPAGAFQVSSRSASLDVDLNAIPVDLFIGEVPANGVISIDWDGTSVERTSGGTRIDIDNGQVLFVGTRTFVEADATGTAFGDPLFDNPNNSISAVRSAIIIITFDQ